MTIAMEQLSQNTGLTLVLALSYGGRQEILDSVTSIAKLVAAGELAPDDIDDHLFEQHLNTPGLPDPDLIIRTSGEARLSNFLIWQSAYSEMVITDTLWPAFRERELYEALLVYQRRERRFGRLSEQVK